MALVWKRQRHWWRKLITCCFTDSNGAKLQAVHQEELDRNKDKAESYVADLSDLDAVKGLANEILEKHEHLDVLINNAGVMFKITNTVTSDGLDVRLAVNTIAPFLLTQKRLPIMKASGRVVNVSSRQHIQSPV